EQAIAIADGTALQVTEMLAQDDRDLLVAYLRERQEHYSSGSHNTEVVYILVEGEAGTLLASAPADLSPVETPYATDRPFAPYHHQLIIGDQLLEVIAPLPEGNGTVWMGLAR